MIPRVRISPHASKRRGHELSAFARGPYERPLRILIDVDSFDATDEVASLLGFGENPHLQLDPVRLSQIMFHDNGNAVLDWSKPSSVSRHVIRSAAPNIQVIQAWGEPLDFAKDPMLNERLALAMYAERNRCDAFVTSSRQLLSVAQRFYPCGNPVDLAGAFAVVGLHLRLREDFVVDQHPSFRGQTDSADFYTSLAQALLPEWWRWASLCPGPSSPMSQSVGGLARAVADRVARALRARDRLHGFLFREASSASIDEALFYFDAFLVALGGAFDAAARVAHATYNISQKVRPSWRTNGWLDKLGSTAPALHQAVMTGTTVRATVDAIFTLRNLLHEEPLRVVGILGTGYQIAEYRAAVPESERGVLVAAVQQLGDIRAWGLDDIQAEFLSLDLGEYAEAVLPAAITGLNELMRLTEVERLGVDAAPPFEPNEALANMSPRLRLLAGI